MNLESFNFKPFYTLDKEWALLSVGNKEKFNMMTVSWGGFGTIWGRPVVSVYVRKSRYTYEFMEENDYFTLSFYDEKYKKDLGILGSKSGRGINKKDLVSLNEEEVGNSISFKEANLTLVCKKIYYDDLKQENMKPEIQEQFYKKDEIHRMYIGEVIDIIDRR